MTTATMSDAFKPMPCFTCGEGTLALRDMQGHAVRYRDLVKVTIAESFVVPGCNRCSEMLLDGPQTRRLGEILQVAHTAERQRQMQEAVSQFISSRGTTQGIAERLLGLSQGYLSKLLYGERVPDVQTFRSVRGLPELSDTAITRLALDEDLAHLLPKLFAGAAATTAGLKERSTPKPPGPKLVLNSGSEEIRKSKGPARKQGKRRSFNSDDAILRGSQKLSEVTYANPSAAPRRVAENFTDPIMRLGRDTVIGAKAGVKHKSKLSRFTAKKKSSSKSAANSASKPSGKARS